MRAHESLLAGQYREVFRFVRRRVRSAEDAEDLTQEVFIHLLKRIGSFRGDSKFTTWLHRVTVNQVLMSLRRRKKRPEVSLEERPAMRDAREAKSPTGLPLADKIALKRAVASLPQGYRVVFWLYDVEGFDHAEVGRILGVAAGTSKSQLHKARLKLRELLLQQATQNC